MTKRPARRKLRLSERVSEARLHIAVAAFLRAAWPDDLIFFHTPNGEARPGGAAGKLKAMGVLPGVPDFTFLLPNGQAAFIELKARDGELSDAQIAFRDKAVALHCGYAVARSIEDVERVLSGWLALFGRKLKARTVERPGDLPFSVGAAA